MKNQTTGVPSYRLDSYTNSIAHQLHIVMNLKKFVDEHFDYTKYLCSIETHVHTILLVTQHEHDQIYPRRNSRAI